VVLGEGDPYYEVAISALAARHPDRISVRIGYDTPLAHRIQAGSDFILMPSIFEPCGLSQMYAMRYGTIPIVRGVGGLADTVTDYRPGSDDGTGFVFHDATPQALMEAIHRALSVYRHRKVWPQLRRNAMTRDFSWRRSSEEYLAVYEKVLSEPAAPIPRRSLS
jgi:starch synthase